MGSTLTWERGRKLSTMSLANGSTASYKYNADGVRTQKTVGGVTTDYFLEGSTIVAQKTGNDVIWYYFDGDGTRDAIEYNGNVYYYMYNPQGDVIGLFDKDLNVVVEYTYDSWGKVETTGTLKDTLGKANPFRYRGYYYDEESGMYYLNSRYYHPEIGRFINADDFDILGVQGDLYDKNLFAYCDNNPIMRADNGGYFWNIVAGAAIGGLFELGGQLLSGKSLSEVNWAKVGVATLAGGVTAAVGPLAGAAISGVANISLDVMSGERDVKKLLVSGAIGAGASLAGSAGGKVAEKIGGKVVTKVLSKMSKTKLKTTITSLMPSIKGAERNAIKNVSYLTNKYPSIGTQYLMSSRLGSAVITSIGQITEGLAGIGVNYGRARCFPSW